MKTIKIFLASSSELLEDRRTFEIFLNRRNKILIKEGIFLELVIWEDFLDAVSQTRLQDEYNKALKQCDIFIMLFYTKVGKYTEEEFNTAYQEFKANGTPLIFTYFKAATSEIETQESLNQFKAKLSDLGHFFTVYNNVEGLQLHFMEQLEKLEHNGIIETKKSEEIIAEPDKSTTKANPVLFKKINMLVANGDSVTKIMGRFSKEILALIDDDDLKNELFVLQGKSTKLERAIRRGDLRDSDATVKANQITNAFMDIMEEIKNLQ